MTPGDFQILKSTTTEPSFRAAEESDSETLIAFMREYYALDGHGFDVRKAHVALTTLLRNPNLGRVWLILDGEPVGYIVICFGHSLEWLGRDAFVDESYLREIAMEVQQRRCCKQSA
jgi:diamine N-acetyltransferase